MQYSRQIPSYGRRACRLPRGIPHAISHAGAISQAGTIGPKAGLPAPTGYPPPSFHTQRRSTTPIQYSRQIPSYGRRACRLPRGIPHAISHTGAISQAGTIGPKAGLPAPTRPSPVLLPHTAFRWDRGKKPRRHRQATNYADTIQQANTIVRKAGLPAPTGHSPHSFHTLYSIWEARQLLDNAGGWASPTFLPHTTFYLGGSLTVVQRSRLVRCILFQIPILSINQVVSQAATRLRITRKRLLVQFAN
jgi:hypothetical protein